MAENYDPKHKSGMKVGPAGQEATREEPKRIDKLVNYGKEVWTKDWDHVVNNRKVPLAKVAKAAERFLTKSANPLLREGGKLIGRLGSKLVGPKGRHLWHLGESPYYAVAGPAAGMYLAGTQIPGIKDMEDPWSRWGLATAIGSLASPRLAWHGIRGGWRGLTQPNKEVITEAIAGVGKKPMFTHMGLAGTAAAVPVAQGAISFGKGLESVGKGFEEPAVYKVKLKSGPVVEVSKQQWEAVKANQPQMIDPTETKHDLTGATPIMPGKPAKQFTRGMARTGEALGEGSEKIIGDISSATGQLAGDSGRWIAVDPATNRRWSISDANLKQLQAGNPVEGLDLTPGQAKNMFWQAENLMGQLSTMTEQGVKFPEEVEEFSGEAAKLLKGVRKVAPYALGGAAIAGLLYLLYKIRQSRKKKRPASRTPRKKRTLNIKEPGTYNISWDEARGLKAASDTPFLDALEKQAEDLLTEVITCGLVKAG